VVEGAEQPSLAVHGKIAGRPDRRRAHIAGKNRIICRQFVHDLGDVLRVHWLAARVPDGQLIEILADFFVVPDELPEVSVIWLLLEQGQEGTEGRFDIAD
jgi:hypothetical protein